MRGSSAAPRPANFPSERSAPHSDAKPGVTFVISANQTSALGGEFLDLLFSLYPAEQP